MYLIYACGTSYHSKMVRMSPSSLFSISHSIEIHNPDMTLMVGQHLIDIHYSSDKEYHFVNHEKMYSDMQQWASTGWVKLDPHNNSMNMVIWETHIT